MRCPSSEAPDSVGRATAGALVLFPSAPVALAAASAGDFAVCFELAVQPVGERPAHSAVAVASLVRRLAVAAIRAGPAELSAPDPERAVEQQPLPDAPGPPGIEPAAPQPAVRPGLAGRQQLAAGLVAELPARQQLLAVQQPGPLQPAVRQTGELPRLAEPAEPEYWPGA